MTKCEIKFFNTMMIIESGLLQQVSNKSYFGTVNTLIQHAGRQVGNAINDAGSDWSRLMTEDALNIILSGGEETTQDHPHSRQVMGEQHITKVVKNKRQSTYSELQLLYTKSRRTIITSKEENNKLTGPQNNFKNWIRAYKAIGNTSLFLIDPSIYQWKTHLKRGEEIYKELTLLQSNKILVSTG